MNVTVQLVWLAAQGSELLMLCAPKVSSPQRLPARRALPAQLGDEILPIDTTQVLIPEGISFSPSVGVGGEFRGLVLWGQPPHSPACPPQPWSHTNWVLPEVLNTVLQRVTTPWCCLPPLTVAHAGQEPLEQQQGPASCTCLELSSRWSSGGLASDYPSATETLCYVLLSAGLK